MVSVIQRYLKGDLNAALKDDKHAAKFAMPTYSQAAPRVMEQSPETDIFLGRYAIMGMRRTYGQKAAWHSRYQEEGTCVGQGYASGGDIVMGINALLAGNMFPGRASAGAIYAGSRVEIGRKPGSWQGSVGSWAADWVTKYGLVTLEDLGLNSNIADEKQWLREIAKDERSGMAWTASNSGVPTNVEEIAKRRPVEITPKVTSLAEVRAALSNLSPVVLCGGVHPSQQLDSRGCSVRLERGGSHCTILIGAYYDGSQWWYDHLQSWWKYYKGAFCRQSHRTDRLFAGSVARIPESWVSNWLKSDDCYAMVGVQGLEPVDIDSLS